MSGNASQTSNYTEMYYVVSPSMAVLMYIMYISVSLLAVGGNVMVCYVILAHQRMRTVTNYFILNLAIGDILMACLCTPFGFVSNLLLQYWPFGPVMCVVVSYAQVVSVFLSAYTLIAISIDRYIAILYPLRPRMTRLQSKVIILVVWMVALVTPLPTALLSKLEVPEEWSQREETSRYVCTEDWESQEQKYHYSMALMVLQYFFPLAVLTFTYGRIAVVVWGNKPPGEAEDHRDQRLAASKRKMVRMMIVVVTAFSLCWLPLNVLIVVGDLDNRVWEFPHIMYVWFACHWLAMSHAAYNPLIYGWMSGRFRDGFVGIARTITCSKWPESSPILQRCNTYTTYTSNLSVYKSRNGKPSPSLSGRTIAHRYQAEDGPLTDEDTVKNSQV